MDYGALPPEINSARMYTGAGSETMLAAAAAWDNLAAELRSTATSQASVISGLTTAWRGPSSANMAAAAAPYTTWLTTTAAQAEHTANQARTAASAYETAFAATVPPPVIAANRAELASLVSTNIVGQNTAAIAANETHYANMWAQDSITMYRYAGQSAAATQVTPFNPPPHTTNPAATAAQSAAATQATGTSAGSNAQSILTQLTSATPNALQSLAAPTATADPSSPLSALLAIDRFIASPLSPGNLFIIPSTPQFVGVDTLGLVLEGGTIPEESGEPGPAGLDGVTTRMGGSGLIGGMSVPQSWSSAAPAIKTAAAMLPDSGPPASAAPVIRTAAAALPQGGPADGAVPAALPAEGPDTLFGTIALSSLAGRVVAGSGGVAARSAGVGDAAVAGASAVTANIYFVTARAHE
ncbi:PPE family protein [Mycobacterium sp.]|uniref:PPE family protein n=1 Tax=Mycobacterium sp. TaxID=1785 RepID=UPI0031D32E35